MLLRRCSTNSTQVVCIPSVLYSKYSSTRCWSTPVLPHNFEEKLTKSYDDSPARSIICWETWTVMTSRMKIEAILRFLTLLNFVATSDSANSRLDGRFSFSLTSFDPKGRLNQVERASRAVGCGTPVVTLRRTTCFLLAAPQALPHPLVEDDGTARFARVSADLEVAADGCIAGRQNMNLHFMHLCR